MSLSCVLFFVTPRTVVRQAPLSMGFSRQEYWSELPCPPPRDLPDPGVEPTYLSSPELAGEFFTSSATWEAHNTEDNCSKGDGEEEMEAQRCGGCPCKGPVWPWARRRTGEIYCSSPSGEVHWCSENERTSHQKLWETLC